MENQNQEQKKVKMTKEHKLMFVPDGICPYYGCDITKVYDLDEINDIISGCPKCHRSFVD